MNESNQMPPFTLGIYKDLPHADYLAVEAISSSGAKKILRSPQHYKLMRDKPGEPTPTQRFGIAGHCALFQPHLYADQYVCAPNIDKRSKDGKAAWAEFAEYNAGKTILTEDEFDRVRCCVEAVKAHPAAAHLLDGGERELSLFWRDKQYDVPAKCRFDAFNRGGGIDLKTCADASPEAFARSAANFFYHIQAAHYMSGAEHVLNETPRFFVFICVESEEPFGVACYVLESNAILAGQALMSRAMERYAAALAAGEWPGYPSTVEVLQLPRWATTLSIG
jgi:PDDEXK-like domain of unknown function (DUF3799)